MAKYIAGHTGAWNEIVSIPDELKRWKDKKILYNNQYKNIMKLL